MLKDECIDKDQVGYQIYKNETNTTPATRSRKFADVNDADEAGGFEPDAGGGAGEVGALRLVVDDGVVDGDEGDTLTL